MRNFLIIERARAIFISLLMITFGVLFVALPDTSFDVLVKVLAWILIVGGVCYIISYFLYHSIQISSAPFINGLLMLSLGLLLLYAPSIYIVLIGFGLSFVGIEYIGSALDQKRAGVKGWWKDLIYGIVEFVIGAILVVLRYSSAAHEAVMIYLGVSLIVDGLFICIGLFTLRRTARKIEKALRE